MTRIEHLYINPPPDGSVAALATDLRLRGFQNLLASPLLTLLIGRGNPNFFREEGVEGVREILGATHLDGIEEWTVEANPEDLTPDLLQRWRGAGVTRPHISLQSLNREVLGWLECGHTPEVAGGALSLLRGSHFPTWGVDLLFALPRELGSQATRTVEELVAIGVPHISLYELTAEEGSELLRHNGTPAFTLPGEEERAEEYQRVAEFLQSEGYEAYEVTGFALPGHASRHGISMLMGGSCLGVGPGAESFIGGRLYRNLPDWQDYSGALAEGRIAEEDVPPLSSEEVELLRVWSALKLRSGLDRDELSEEARALGERWISDGLARKETGRVALTLQGWLRLDGLALEMCDTMIRSRKGSRGNSSGG